MRRAFELVTTTRTLREELRGSTVHAERLGDAGYVTLPSAMFSPLSSAGFSCSARFQPLFASCSAYGSVALVSASVDVRGTPPGMFATP